MDDINHPNGLERAERHLTPVKCTIDIKPWFAQILKKELNAEYTFCRIGVTDVLAVSAKAVQVTGYFNTMVGRTCYCCGALLDTEISKASGIGPVCARKRGVPRSKASDAAAIIEHMDQLARVMGKFTTWIPKRQIVTEVDWQALAPARVAPPPPVLRTLAPNQIQIAGWLAAKNGVSEVLTVLRKKAETAKWVLLVVQRDSWLPGQSPTVELGVPKSQIVQGTP